MIDLFLFTAIAVLLASGSVLVYLSVELHDVIELENEENRQKAANNLRQPTSSPTLYPLPSYEPTFIPTVLPTESPTSPTASPSYVPTADPTANPSTQSPSFNPTYAPSSTSKPTFTAIPTVFPSRIPTFIPSASSKPSTSAPSYLSTASSAPTTNILRAVGAFTYYNIYPRCCQGQSNYDPTYPTTECIEYNGCRHPGQLAAIGYRSLDYVQNNNLIAFYDNADPDGLNFYSKYANKYIDITATCNGVTKTIRALIADTCGNRDCASCCSRNSNPSTGFLVDMDYNTVMNNFGTTNCAVGNVLFSIDLSQPPAIPNCGVGIGSCNGLYCCGSNNVCGAGPSFCEAGCQSSYGFCSTTPYSCGPNGNKCTSGNCCSQYGYCGNTTTFCGIGCLSNYGRCDSIPTTAPVMYPTWAPTK